MTEFDFLNEKIEAFRQAIEAEIKAKDEIIMLHLKQILEQTTKTNGRLCELEKNTSVWTFFQRNWKLAILVVFGIIFLSNLGFEKLITYLK